MKALKDVPLERSHDDVAPHEAKEQGMDDGGKLGGGLAYRSGLATEISTALALACLTCSELPGRFCMSCENHNMETR